MSDTETKTQTWPVRQLTCELERHEQWAYDLGIGLPHPEAKMAAHIASESLHRCKNLVGEGKSHRVHIELLQALCHMEQVEKLCYASGISLNLNPLRQLAIQIRAQSVQPVTSAHWATVTQ